MTSQHPVGHDLSLELLELRLRHVSPVRSRIRSWSSLRGGQRLVQLPGLGVPGVSLHASVLHLTDGVLQLLNVRRMPALVGTRPCRSWSWARGGGGGWRRAVGRGVRGRRSVGTRGRSVRGSVGRRRVGARGRGAMTRGGRTVTRISHGSVRWRSITSRSRTRSVRPRSSMWGVTRIVSWSSRRRRTVVIRRPTRRT